MQSLVSIIIPNYNRAELIGETLLSIIAQTYTYWECIIVDDGSTDNSLQVIHTFTQKDNRIKLYHRPKDKPKGANACRNYGLELSKGIYINWFDSDDIMREDKLMLQVNGLDTNYKPFSVCQSYVFENNIENIIGLKSENILSKAPFEDFISKKIIIPIQAPIFRKEFLNNYNYQFDEELQAGQEWYFFAKILFEHPDYHVINEPLDYIRHHANNISNHISNKKYWHYFLAREKLYNDLKNKLNASSIKSLNLFFLFIFKFFARSKDFRNSWYVWTHQLKYCSQLTFRDHTLLLLGLLLYQLTGKGDGFLSKVSLYDKENSEMTLKAIYKKVNYRLLKLKIYLRHYFMLLYHHHCNSVVKRQIKNPKSIPIIIISFNQLHYLRQLVDFLQRQGYTRIVILDNASTYTPLLDYFETIKNQVTIHRLNTNIGHLSFWKSPEIYKLYCKGYYVVTDADVVPIAECPEDFMDTFRRLLDKAYDRTKVGFSLKIDDIPDSNPNKAHIEAWESQYWRTEVLPHIYKAPIDTTFALYRPRYRYRLKRFTYAWRTGAPMQALHGGWYIDVNALTEEQAYYMKTANSSASWQINDKGDLINSTHQPLYTHGK